MVDIFYPLQWIADRITYDLFGLAVGTNLGDAINFIFYDVMKIFVLLSAMIYVISYLRTYVNPEVVREKLTGKDGVIYHFMASGVGVISPFCSCSSVPLFIGFVKAGVPLGVTFSFLITSPLVNEAAIAVLWGIFGFNVMMIYVFSGVLIGVIGGRIIHYLRFEKYVEDFVYKIHSKSQLENIKQTQVQRRDFAFNEMRDVIKKVGLYIVIGVGIGGFFHGYLPKGWIMNYLGRDNVFAVPIATLVGIPLYVSVLGTIPVVESLIGKGLSIGTALAFLMAVTALSLPEMIMLKKVLKMKLLVIFVIIVSVSIVFTGYLFNIIL